VVDAQANTPILERSWLLSTDRTPPALLLHQRVVLLSSQAVPPQAPTVKLIFGDLLLVLLPVPAHVLPLIRLVAGRLVAGCGGLIEAHLAVVEVPILH